MKLLHPLTTLACLAFLTTTAMSQTPAASSAKPAPSPKPTLGSTVFDWQKLAVKTTKTGERRDLVDASSATFDNFESHITTIKPGEVPHAPHRHPDEEIIIVKEGLLEVTINGQTQRAGAGSMFFFASNDLHGMKNVGEVNATYFVIRIRTTATPKA